jgi:DNA-binding HxlR family transcriptional regulator
MSSYGQFCPVSKAMEVLDERWTMLVIRELLLGSTHFNELRRGVPKMSPALLSKRLKSLERYGLVTRTVGRGQTTYGLTDAGRELHEVIDGLGAWGLRWIGNLGEEDLDPHLLMWDIRRTVPIDRWPRRRTVVSFELSGFSGPGSRWWLVVADGEADLCDVDPGYEVSAVVSATLRALTRLWRGDIAWTQAVRAGDVAISASSLVSRQIPQWLGQSRLASTPRVQVG